MIRRYEHNPILTKADVPYPVATVHNPGAVKHEGRYLLLFRSHRLNGRSIIALAESGDGFHFKVETEAVYRLGAALPDLKDPSRVLGVADEWILEPEDPWERVGYVHNVVFCCGGGARGRRDAQGLLGWRRHRDMRRHCPCGGVGRPVPQRLSAANVIEQRHTLVVGKSCAY